MPIHCHEQRARLHCKPVCPTLPACPVPTKAGERRCLACGRAFRGDIQRFLQHLKDAHGGRNAPPGAEPAAALGSAAVPGAAGRTPGLRSVLQLGDVLLRAAPAPRSAQRPAARQQQQQPQQSQQQQQQGQRQPSQQAQRQWPAPKPPPAAAAAAVPRLGPVPPAAVALAAAPPPGTRQRSRRKRESRLKRAFRRSSAVQAVTRWQGVLAGEHTFCKRTDMPLPQLLGSMKRHLLSLRT